MQALPPPFCHHTLVDRFQCPVTLPHLCHPCRHMPNTPHGWGKARRCWNNVFTAGASWGGHLLLSNGLGVGQKSDPRHLPYPAFRHLTSIISSSPLACIIITAWCACRQATSQVNDRDRLQVGRHLCMEAEHLETQRKPQAHSACSVPPACMSSSSTC